MSKAIRLHKQGGPEVMVWEDVEVGDPGPGQVRVRHNACGLNYIDVYHRSGLYPLPMPSATAWRMPLDRLAPMRKCASWRPTAW